MSKTEKPVAAKQPARPTIKAVRGTRDLLPAETPLWNRVEATARAVFARYGFGEIRTPIFEATELFARGVGEETDVVSKEMFTWEDGERFSEKKLISAWRDANDPNTYILNQEARFFGLKWNIDLIVSRFGSGAVEFVDFKPKASIQAVDWLITAMELAKRSEPDNYGSKKLLGRLVVPAGKAKLGSSFVLPEDIVIEEIAADVFDTSQQLTLRPENTAGVVRSYIENKLGESGALQKLYYIGPQFRRERPQRGRYRQFWQIGAEVLGPPSSGSDSPLRDAEVLEMLASFLDELGVRGWRLELNSVGSAEDRVAYNAVLRTELAKVKDKLCPDNQRRAETNPLRVLDSKDEADQEIINALPKIGDYLSPESRAHFDQVLAALDACGVEYHLNPRLVRGLDYYTRTTFEFTVPSGDATGLGTQNALLGGGRYDGLSEMLGGPRAPGIGFAIGEDRLILTLQAQAEADGASIAATKLDAYIAPLGVAQNPAALVLARELRAAGLTVEVGDGSFKLRKSFEIGDSLARHIILLGEDEVATNTATVKTFATGVQKKVERSALLEVLRKQDGSF
jgi:histidyl-tRNA synthetase